MTFDIRTTSLNCLLSFKTRGIRCEQKICIVFLYYINFNKIFSQLYNLVHYVINLINIIEYLQLDY